MTLRLNGSTSGYSEIDAPAIAGDQVFTLPTTGGTLDRINRAGNILQVVQATYSTEITVASTTLTDSGLSASITPSSASNKVLVLVSQQALGSRGNTAVNVLYSLLRGSTGIFNPTGLAMLNSFGSGNATGVEIGAIMTFKYLDSPATTSSVTYKTQGAVSSTGSSGLVKFQNGGAPSSMILLEVAA